MSSVMTTSCGAGDHQRDARHDAGRRSESSARSRGVRPTWLAGTVTNASRPLLSDDSIEAISNIATSWDDVKAVLGSVGITYRMQEPIADGYVAVIPGVDSHLRRSLKALDLEDPDEVGRVLRAVLQLVELYQVSKRYDGTKLVRLRMALEADGIHVARTGNFTEAFSDLALTASNALSDISGIRAEIQRLEKAIPDDPAAAIGRAKNLVEATAKAVLASRGKPASGAESLQGLASQALEELGIHPKQATGEREQVRRILGRLQGLVGDLTELRNEVGDGHGTAATPPDLEGRHGRLAVWAALGWASYVLDSLGTASSRQAQAAE